MGTFIQNMKKIKAYKFSQIILMEFGMVKDINLTNQVTFEQSAIEIKKMDL